MRQVKYVEIIFIIIAVLFAYDIFIRPLFYHEKRRNTGCTANLRQLAMEISMYSQDNNGRLPGLYKCGKNGKASNNYTGWLANIYPYIKGSNDMTKTKLQEKFCCPDIDKKMKKYVSYGYNAALLQPDGLGILEKRIVSPKETGFICDSDPMQILEIQGGIIGNSFTGTMVPMMTVKPVGRHTGGVIIGYADGHVQIVPDRYDENDKENGVNKAFYRAVELGYIKNKVKGK
jgi:prepilin-type processing-associated H-X9-DG protein